MWCEPDASIAGTRRLYTANPEGFDIHINIKSYFQMQYFDDIWQGGVVTVVFLLLHAYISSCGA